MRLHSDKGLRPILCAFISLALLGCFAFAQESDSPDPSVLLKALREADAVFTATISKVNPIGMTNSIPPSVFGEVTFKDIRPLRGAAPTLSKFSYSYKEGATGQLDLMAKGTLVVAVRQKGLSVVVPATEANLALAKKAATKD